MAANFDTYFARKHRYEYERGPLRDLLLNIPLVPQSFTVKAQPSIIYQADFFALCFCSDSLKNHPWKIHKLFLIAVTCFKSFNNKCHKLFWIKINIAENKYRWFYNSLKMVIVVDTNNKTFYYSNFIITISIKIIPSLPAKCLKILCLRYTRVIIERKMGTVLT